MSEEKNRVKEIITDYEKLSQVSEAVNTRAENLDIREINLDLKATIIENNLLALSAPQIGVYKRIFCVKDKKGLHTFVNPMIKKSTDMCFSREKDEGSDKEYIYPRSNKIVVDYQTPMGDLKATTVVGYSAYVFQRMIDHLNGVLISDIGLEIDEQWDNATEEERAEVLKAYAESLDLLNSKIEEEINSNEELTKQKKAIDFEHALVAGEIELQQDDITNEQKEQIENKLKQVFDKEEK